MLNKLIITFSSNKDVTKSHVCLAKNSIIHFGPCSSMFKIIINSSIMTSVEKGKQLAELVP